MFPSMWVELLPHAPTLWVEPLPHAPTPVGGAPASCSHPCGWSHRLMLPSLWVALTLHASTMMSLTLSHNEPFFPTLFLWDFFWSQ